MFRRDAAYMPMPNGANFLAALAPGYVAPPGATPIASRRREEFPLPGSTPLLDADSEPEGLFLPPRRQRSRDPSMPGLEPLDSTSRRRTDENDDDMPELQSVSNSSESDYESSSDEESILAAEDGFEEQDVAEVTGLRSLRAALDRVLSPEDSGDPRDGFSPPNISTVDRATGRISTYLDEDDSMPGLEVIPSSEVAQTSTPIGVSASSVSVPVPSNSGDDPIPPAEPPIPEFMTDGRGRVIAASNIEPSLIERMRRMFTHRPDD